MKRCISTGNIDIAGSSSMDPFVEVSYKKARKLRQTGTKTGTKINDEHLSQSAMDVIISSVANTMDSEETVCSITKPINLLHNNNCICNELKLELKDTKDVIVQLQTKLDFLMSYLGLTDNGNNTTVPGCQLQAQSASDLSVFRNNISGGVQGSHPSYSSAVRSSKQPASTQLSSQFHQAVLSAVYVDLHSKSARANNIIISGLPKVTHTEDKDLVEELISNEFNLQPAIKHCKRIGKMVTDKSQSLLVTLESSDHANIIQSNAKQLRRSGNDFVRDNVFINADLTKAEATAAYEERCRRRQLHHERTSKQQQQEQQLPQQKTKIIQSSTMLSSAGSSSRAIGSTIVAVTSDSLLNVTVPEFYPSSSVHTAVGQSVSSLTSTSSSVSSSVQGLSIKK
jgi:hypothetical protein